MYDPSIPYLFKNSDKLAHALQTRDDFKTDALLISTTCEYLIEDLARFWQFGSILLEYIVSTNSKLDTVSKFKLIDRYFMPNITSEKEQEEHARTKRHRHEELTLQQTDNSSDDQFSTRLRQMIFSYCLKVRDTQEELYDAEVYQLLYSILSRCAPYIPVTAWETELESSVLQRKRMIIQDCDDLIDRYISVPASYPHDFRVEDYCKRITYDKDIELIISIKVALNNALFDTELSPIPLTNHFEFSAAWISFLQRIQQSSGAKLFKLYADSIENDFYLLRTKAESNLQIVPYQKDDSDLISLHFANQEEYETVYKEGIQSLKYAPARFITTLVYALYQLIAYGYKDDTGSNAQHLSGEFSTMGLFTVWNELFEATLNSLALDSKPCRESPYFHKLVKIAACYIQFRYLLNGIDRRSQSRLSIEKWPPLTSIWDHFYLQRTIFLKSMRNESESHVVEEKQDDIRWIEKILFTSACSALNGV